MCKKINSEDTNKMAGKLNVLRWRAPLELKVVEGLNMKTYLALLDTHRSKFV